MYVFNYCEVTYMTTAKTPGNLYIKVFFTLTCFNDGVLENKGRNRTEFFFPWVVQKRLGFD